MELCPNCHRKLISHASSRCNWCGHVIDDAHYQAQAAANREALIAQQYLHDAQRAVWLNSTLGGSVIVDPILGIPQSLNTVPPPQLTIDAAQHAHIRAERMGPLPAGPQPLEILAEPAPEPQGEPETVQGDRFGHLEIE
jgi:hypothetical protein